MSVTEVEAGLISTRIVAGNVDDELLRQISELRQIPPGLAGNMLMVLSDTESNPLRNILALTLAESGVQQAASRIANLVKESKTAGARGTLLYALHLLEARLDLPTLIHLILNDTAEAREEALVLLEDLLEDGVAPDEIQKGIQEISKYTFMIFRPPEVATAARELLIEALAAS